VAQAQQRLGISKPKMAALLAEGRVQTYSDPLNKRVKLLREGDLETLRRPVETDQKKAAA
jgi:hypothetical protein